MTDDVWVVFRHRVPPGDEEAFVQAWGRCKQRIQARAPGAREAVLLRRDDAPGEFVTATRWASHEDWRAFWDCGRVADPEGDPRLNEVWVEVARVGEPAAPVQGHSAAHDAR